MKLSELQKNQVAKIIRIDDDIEDEQRRRLFDLGILPGTQIVIDFENAFGNPVAYKVRNTIIALRKEHSEKIYIEIINKVM